jgi:hypothetical protein
MANYFIEGAQPKDHDSKERSLQKINSLLYNAVDGSGKLQIGGVALDALELNTDQVEGKLDTTNALLTTTAADVAATKASAASIAGLSIPAHNRVVCTNTSGKLTKVQYYQGFVSGGSAGTLVATTDITYDANGDLLTLTTTL